MTGIWLLPTRARPTETLALLRKCPLSMRIFLLVNREDPCLDAYLGMQEPNRISVFMTENEGMASKCQECFTFDHSKHDWLGVLTDDLEPDTDDWADQLVSHVKGWNIVASNDGWQRRMQGAVVFSGDLLRAVGYMAPPGLKHLYFDDVWETLGKDTGCLQYDMGIIVRHEHADLKEKPSDETRQKVNTFWKEDEAAYRTWQQNERIPAGERIMQLMREKGLQVEDNRLDGVRLLVACPTGKGTVERAFLYSLFKTQYALRENGAHMEFFDVPYCSDPALARAKIFTTFLNSPTFTHLLQVDDDMGWNWQDVIRMLKADEAFIAAAGPRKAFPPSYAFSNVDDFGRMKPVAMGQGMAEVSHVGGAFVLINRYCADRMAQMYADLAFDSHDGREVINPYLPMIKNRRWIGEDFAFCERWRAIGGKVLILPEVRLKHVGSYTWEGSASEFFAEQAGKFQEAAE